MFWVSGKDEQSLLSADVRKFIFNFNEISIGILTI